MSQLSTALGSNAGSTSNASWASMATANMQRLKPNARFKGTHDLGFMLQVCVWGGSQGYLGLCVGGHDLGFMLQVCMGGPGGASGALGACVYG